MSYIQYELAKCSTYKTTSLINATYPLSMSISFVYHIQYAFYIYWLWTFIKFILKIYLIICSMDFSSENYKQKSKYLRHCIQYFKRAPLNSPVCNSFQKFQNILNIIYILSQKSNIFSISVMKKSIPNCIAFKIIISFELTTNLSIYWVLIKKLSPENIEKQMNTACMIYQIQLNTK